MKTWMERVIHRGFAPPRSGVNLAAALEELRLVHRMEQAALLRAADLLVCATLHPGRLYVAGSRHSPRDGLPGERRRSWREACLEEIATAGSDGAEVHPVLRTLSATPIRSWPPASVLALASLELERCPAGFLDLARAWTAEGRPGAAIGILRDLLAEGPLAADRLELLEALAMAFEAAGEDEKSLVWYAAALGAPGSQLRVAVSMLSLALRCGDVTRTEIAAERLRSVDLAVPGTRVRFRNALTRALARAFARTPSQADEAGTALRDAHTSTRAEGIRRLALDGRGAEADLAWAMLLS